MLSGTDSALHRVISLSLMMSMIHTTGRIFSWVCLFVSLNQRQNFLGQDGDPRESHPLQPQSDPSLPVKTTRNTLKTKRDTALTHSSRQTAPIGPAQPPSPESPHDHTGFWATIRATVSLSGVASTLVTYLDEKFQRLLNFRCP